jgi:ribulose-5-phosphate 4-epimerase/fuculose-1-phosphate aldolase
MTIKKDLASAYQIIAKLGLDDHTYTHLSARPEGADFYYIFPFGLRFGEVTEDILLKVSLDGKVLEGSEYEYNKTGYVIHGSIYKQREDLNAVFHLHTVPNVAVSAMKQGLMPISQWALHFYGQVAYHNYNSLALDEKQQGGALARDLADKNIMFLRNHGTICCGKTICEAMFYCYHLELACQTQIAALSSGAELIIPDEKTCRKTNDDLLKFEKDLGRRDWEAWLRYI